MRGIILAGGSGTRLSPLTKITSKQLLPVYDKPMIFYPLEKLAEAGLKQIMIISGRGHAGHFLELIGSGKNFGLKITYEVQEEAGGIAQALALAEDFADDGKTIVILGDNIFDDSIKKAVNRFQKQKAGARIFLKQVPDANRFGVAQVKGDKIISIEEKPAKPKTNLAVTGLYMYDRQVFEIIRKLKPSARGELEITDVNNAYIKKNRMKYEILSGHWTDAGTVESLYRASRLVREKLNKSKT